MDQAAVHSQALTELVGQEDVADVLLALVHPVFDPQRDARLRAATCAESAIDQDEQLGAVYRLIKGRT